MTRINLLGASVSLVTKTCHPRWLCPAPKTAGKVPWRWAHLCCGVPGQGQVLAGSCVSPASVHLHSSTTQAAPSTPDPENSRGEQERTTSQLLKALVFPPGAGKQNNKPKTQQEAVDTVMAALQDLFSMKDLDALEVLISCLPSRTSYTDVLHNLHILKECGIEGPQIQRIPWIIAQKSGKLSEKLVKIRGPYLFREHHEGLGFCYLSLDLMSYYQKRFRKEAPNFPNHPNRIYYLAERIQVPVESFTERIGKPHRTLAMDTKRLDGIIDMLHRYGVTPEDIVADLWVFGYCPKRAEDRLRRAAELGCTELRPWMCRCSDKIFDRFCARYQSGRELLGEHGSVFDFLSERLDCDRSEVERAFQSNIIMKRVHISKFNRILDLLFSEGITTKDIRMCMRIFQYSEVRTAARIKELKEAGFFPFPLNILCRTPARFRTILLEFKKRKYKEPTPDEEVNG